MELKNIIKAQNYQLVRSRNLRSVVIGFSALTLLFVFIIHNNGGEYPLKGSEICSMLISMLSTFNLLLSAVVTSMVCGDDFGDRAVNFELSSGTRRIYSFLGRALPAIFFSTGAVLLQYVIMTAGAAAVSSTWGCELEIGGVIQRTLIALPIFMRLSAFCVLLTYIIKKPIAVVIILQAIAVMMSMLADEGGLALSTSLMSGMTSLSKALSFRKWYTFALGGDQRIICEPYLTAGEWIPLVLVSLSAAAAYIAAAYHFFLKDDLK